MVTRFWNSIQTNSVESVYVFPFNSSSKGAGSMASQRPSKPINNDEKFDRIWFSSLARFHRIADPAEWQFDEEHVIAFLRAKLEVDMPTMKRLQIVKGLIW